MIVVDVIKNPQPRRLEALLYHDHKDDYHLPGLFVIPNKTNIEAKISVVDSIASAIKAYEFAKKPAMLIIAKQVFPRYTK
jgi:hypothetical protein